MLNFELARGGITSLTFEMLNFWLFFFQCRRVWEFWSLIWWFVRMCACCVIVCLILSSCFNWAIFYFWLSWLLSSLRTSKSKASLYYTGQDVFTEWPHAARTRTKSATTRSLLSNRRANLWILSNFILSFRISYFVYLYWKLETGICFWHVYFCHYRASFKSVTFL